ncbi:MAG: hypothetical protein EOM67_17275, partial [Spirochaetia bacterium]|nr:hypothetical protein [Spirochaetia bacterium]
MPSFSSIDVSGVRDLIDRINRLKVRQKDQLTVIHRDKMSQLNKNRGYMLLKAYDYAREGVSVKSATLIGKRFRDLHMSTDEYIAISSTRDRTRYITNYVKLSPDIIQRMVVLDEEINNLSEQISKMDEVIALRGFGEGSSGIDLFMSPVMLNTIGLLEEIGLNVKEIRGRVEEIMNGAINRLKISEEMKNRLTVRNWQIEVVEEDGMDVQSRYEEADGGLARIRISKGMVEFLKKLRTEMSEEKYQSLMQEIFLHERIEMLYKQRHPEASAQKAHEFALANAGDRQRNLVEALPKIEVLSKIESGKKMSREELELVQNMIDEIK